MAVPIPVPLEYKKLILNADKGNRVPYKGPCTNNKCKAKASFVYTGISAKRNVAVILATMLVYYLMFIPLARCSACGRWARVLPVEILPRKLYGIQVIETAMRFYISPDNSLRDAVVMLPTEGERLPWHTTLHRWLIGLGERVLDRHHEIQQYYPPPASALISETCKKHGLNLSALLITIALFIAPIKYHSERRKNQLEKIEHLLTIAARVYKGNASLMAWALEAIPSFHVAVWNFPCFYTITLLRRNKPP